MRCSDCPRLERAGVELRAVCCCDSFKMPAEPQPQEPRGPTRKQRRAAAALQRAAKPTALQETGE